MEQRICCCRTQGLAGKTHPLLKSFQCFQDQRLIINVFQASTMALDSTGQYVLLAGYALIHLTFLVFPIMIITILMRYRRRCLAIVDVDNPSTVLKRVPRQSKWEVGTAEWNPHSQCSHLCAISSNQRTEILTWDQADLTTSSSLRSHTRVVSDLNWHRFDPAVLATCSVDTFINVWDIRDHRKPSMSFSAVGSFHSFNNSIMTE